MKKVVAVESTLTMVEENVPKEAQDMFAKLQEMMDKPQPNKVKVISDNEVVIAEFDTISEAMTHVTLNDLDNAYIAVEGLGHLRKQGPTQIEREVVQLHKNETLH